MHEISTLLCKVSLTGREWKRSREKKKRERKIGFALRCWKAASCFALHFCCGWNWDWIVPLSTGCGGFSSIVNSLLPHSLHPLSSLIPSFSQHLCLVSSGYDKAGGFYSRSTFVKLPWNMVHRARQITATAQSTSNLNECIFKNLYPLLHNYNFTHSSSLRVLTNMYSYMYCFCSTFTLGTFFFFYKTDTLKSDFCADTKRGWCDVTWCTLWDQNKTTINS